MELVPSFVELVQQVAPVFTAPTFNSFLTVLTGWAFARRRVVTRMIEAADAVKTPGRDDVKHHSAFHRVFSAARWSLDGLGLAVFKLIEPWLDGDAVLLSLDDTLARKRGLKVFGVGMHHDPLLSTRKTALMNWGHSWVVLCVIVALPFRPNHYFSLPILFRLYVNKKTATKKRLRYRTRPELAVEMLGVLCKHYENRRFHAVADSAYGGQSVLANLPANCDLTSRLDLDARLYDPPPVRKPGTKGRPRKRGKRLPTPRQMLEGKIVGLGLLGLLQMVIWAGTSYSLLRVSGRTFSLPAGFMLSPTILIWGVVFFSLGYAIYASLMAGLGALVPNLREASQAVFLVIWPLMMVT